MTQPSVMDSHNNCVLSSVCASHNFTDHWNLGSSFAHSFLQSAEHVTGHSNRAVGGTVIWAQVTEHGAGEDPGLSQDRLPRLSDHRHAVVGGLGGTGSSAQVLPRPQPQTQGAQGVGCGPRVSGEDHWEKEEAAERGRALLLASVA